jgi:elongation factor G
MDSTRSGARLVKAFVPLAEMFGYVTDLRTITSGRASSTMEFHHYAEVDKGNARKVLEECGGRADLIK